MELRKNFYKLLPMCSYLKQTKLKNRRTKQVLSAGLVPAGRGRYTCMKMET
jgi:hypothetical protein